MLLLSQLAMAMAMAMATAMTMAMARTNAHNHSATLARSLLSAFGHIRAQEKKNKQRECWNRKYPKLQ